MGLFRKIMVLAVIGLFIGLSFVPSLSVNHHLVGRVMGGAVPVSQDGGVKDWTFMAYLNGDYNEREEKQVNVYINQLELIGSKSNVDIIVQADCNKIWNDETRTYYIKHDENMDIINSDLTDFDISEKNMGDAETFKNFVTWAMDKYPAERYCVLIYGHGKGWLGNNLLPDVSGRTTMNITQFQDSLTEISEYIAQKSNQTKNKIDILIMIPCYMGMIECCYQIKESVEYYIASEGAMNAGFISLNNTADILAKSSLDNSEDIVQKIVNAAHNDQNQHILFGMNLSKIDSIISDVNNLANIGKNHINNSKKDKVKEAFRESVVYNEEDDPHPHDLIRISQTYNCSNCEEIQNKINDLLIKPRNGSVYHNWNGLSVYFPPSKNTENMEEYKKLDFANDTQWDEFLEAYTGISFSVSGGLGINVVVDNQADILFSNVSWSIDVDGKFVLSAKNDAGIINSLSPGESTTRQTFGLIGFGQITIEVSVAGESKKEDGFLFGPFVFIYPW
jgi:hypothetical protein